MQALDGNAIAGMLFEHFGTEMTEAHGSCAHCGAAAQLAELHVYVRAPGTIVRCPSCGGVVMVIADIRDARRVDSRGLRLRDVAPRK